MYVSAFGAISSLHIVLLKHSDAPNPASTAPATNTGFEGARILAPIPDAIALEHSYSIPAVG